MTHCLSIQSVYKHSILFFKKECCNLQADGVKSDKFLVISMLLQILFYKHIEMQKYQ
jgi:hypothetical protein